jgi:Rne/Rng family ribonuclease
LWTSAWNATRFLYVTDVIDPTAESLEDEDEPVVQAGARGRACCARHPGGGGSRGHRRGRIRRGSRCRGGGVGPAEAPAAPETTAAAPAPQNGNGQRRGGRGAERDRTAPEVRIEDLLKEGQEVVVQVVKEPLGTKGARITSHISLPGRFLVYMPTVDHIGVSRKIESREERKRLRAIVQKFKEESGLPGGTIIRTAAVNRPDEDILSDLEYFKSVWTEVQRRKETQRPPCALYREESLVAKLLRDFLTEQFTAIRIDDETEYNRVVALMGRIMPAMASRVKHYSKDYPIFDEYGVQGEIDKALRSKVWLKSGGYIVINQTEALVAIDVNTGRYVGKKTAGRLEDTIVKTNLEAAKEISRQMRLRDLGGIIVLDFIDMEDKKNRQKVFAGDGAGDAT